MTRYGHYHHRSYIPSHSFFNHHWYSLESSCSIKLEHLLAAGAQCHVPQQEVKAPVTNDFVDIDTLLSRAQPGGRR